jgi:elongation factor G
MGDAVGDINSKRGQVNDMTDRMGIKVIHALIPLSELFGYATSLRGMTQGRASYSMELSHYQNVPSNVAEEIITGKKK